MSDEQWLKDMLNNIDAKVQKLSNKVDDINIRHARQEADLAHHIYRTELAEENIALIREQISPIESHVKVMQSIVKIAGAVSLLVSIGAGIVKILQYIL